MPKGSCGAASVSPWPVSGSGHEPENDPAMRPQSVLTRVKMFENKRSVSVDRARDADMAMRPVDMVPKPGVGPGSVPKANSLSNLDQEKAFRMPEPQQPQSRAVDDIVRSNHYDPDEDEEYYRKQLSYFDRRSFDKPSPAPTPVNKPDKISSAPGNSTGPPPIMPKPTSLDAVSPPPDPLASPKSKPSGREDTVHGNFLPQKSFPEKSPVNGTEPPKTPTGYNRFVPKPYTTSARPFERKFDSPKFNHNLLPNDSTQGKGESSVGGKSPVNNVAKPHGSPQPPDHDSGVDTFTRTMDHRKYPHNNINAVPKAIPVSPGKALDDYFATMTSTRGCHASRASSSNGRAVEFHRDGREHHHPAGGHPRPVIDRIYFKIDNSICPPLDKEKGETLLSPLVMCGPHGLKFLKPVELRLPHCASMTPDGDPKSWQNKALQGDPNYLVGANCVSVLIDHF
ncbi:hypothetical protein AALO_G00268890 [Alosa alosa]|uniref:ZU5 domain-containing protein n=1 Tax=Alosa alosa TaxID=278164 RepID=A0AAV6FQN3_9TELE|nr:hypothetical protein AALO_G00268890 [Alosa alosa]